MELDGGGGGAVVGPGGGGGARRWLVGLAVMRENGKRINTTSNSK